MGQDQEKKNQKILEITGKSRVGGSPGVPSGRGVREVRAWICQGAVALDRICWARAVGARAWGRSRRDDACSVTSWLSWVMLDCGEGWLFILSPQKPRTGLKTDIEAELRGCQSSFWG